MAKTQFPENRIGDKDTKKRKPRPDTEPDDMELEAEREKAFSLNRQKSVFETGSINNAQGINTAPSVFERTAVFKIGGSGEKG